MKATYEFRLDENDASRVMGSGVGRALDGIRVVRLDGTDPKMGLLGEAYAQRHREGESLFYSWDVRRSYDPEELEQAELIHLLVTDIFEPPGEDCGTQYDTSAACQHCGAGRVQVSSLSLDLRSSQPERDIHTGVLRRGKDLTKSIASEHVVSNRLADLMQSAKLKGFELRPILRCGTGSVVDGWQQLVVVGETIEAVTPTTYGNNPFDLDEQGEFRCPLGHVAGLNLLTELTLDRRSWSGDDIVATRQLAGFREGSLVPAPSLLISPALFRQMRDAGVGGARFEVAHLT